MDDLQKQKVISEAAHFWNSGKPYSAGMLIFERIPLIFRPFWAANQLEFVRPYSRHLPEIDIALKFAREPDVWPIERCDEAHRIFYKIRRVSLVDQHDPILTLAEHVTGITYTARQYPAPFDHDRGWRIVDQLYNVAKRYQLDMAMTLNIVAQERYITLDAPIKCHSGCGWCFQPRWNYLELFNPKT